MEAQLRNPSGILIDKFSIQDLTALATEVQWFLDRDVPVPLGSYVEVAGTRYTVTGTSPVRFTPPVATPDSLTPGASSPRTGAPQVATLQAQLQNVKAQPTPGADADVQTASARQPMRELGVILLICGAVLQMVFIGGPLSDYYRGQAVKTSELKSNWAAILSASDKEERDRLDAARSAMFAEAERPALILAAIGTCLSLLLGFIAASKSDKTPVWYYLISGIAPGALIFHGWKRLKPRKPAQI